MEYLWVVPLGIVVGLVAFILDRVKQKRAYERLLAESWGKEPDLGRYDEDDIPTIARYWMNKIKKKPTACAVDPITWNDLDLDDVFKRINVAQSSAGEEVLYALLHTPAHNMDTLAEREKRIALFASNPKLRQETQKILHRLGKVKYNDAASFIFHANGKQVPHAGIYQALSVMPAVCALIGIVWPPAFLLIAAFFAVNIVIHYRTGVVWRSELFSVRYLASLLRCADKLSSFAEPGFVERFARLHQLYPPLRAIRRWGRFLRWTRCRIWIF